MLGLKMASKVAFTGERICAAEIRLSFDCMHFVFFCIYIEKDLAYFRLNICVISKSHLRLYSFGT